MACTEPLTVTAVALAGAVPTADADARFGLPNGKARGDGVTIVKTGERVRITLVNDTMMAHPIHLHGMWSDLEDADGNFQVRKHTIDMPPGTRRSYRVRADALGRWAYHCHLLYHMEAGMFREVRVEE